MLAACSVAAPYLADPSDRGNEMAKSFARAGFALGLLGLATAENMFDVMSAASPGRAVNKDLQNKILEVYPGASNCFTTGQVAEAVSRLPPAPTFLVVGGRGGILFVIKHGFVSGGGSGRTSFLAAPFSSTTPPPNLGASAL